LYSWSVDFYGTRITRAARRARKLLARVAMGCQRLLEQENRP
jgi:hypothetical protein